VTVVVSVAVAVPRSAVEVEVEVEVAVVVDVDVGPAIASRCVVTAELGLHPTTATTSRAVHTSRMRDL
jgi:hypothetical protein